ncbi:hypothetical protein PHYPSEUDO_005172 [Phytophthora pseudosyringae]|uniref:Uncharacterized protein n=1 Tax=Phytophthora pseudosyringae TaxID=221518 RepID=A0A8T1VMJ5_9STRA|nr:hypothetical protein PHYPSEUDO_005172 [Phytophthora pseudosyringae]
MGRPKIRSSPVFAPERRPAGKGAVAANGPEPRQRARAGAVLVAQCKSRAPSLAALSSTTSSARAAKPASAATGRNAHVDAVRRDDWTRPLEPGTRLLGNNAHCTMSYQGMQWFVAPSTDHFTTRVRHCTQEEPFGATHATDGSLLSILTNRVPSFRCPILWPGQQAFAAITKLAPANVQDLRHNAGKNSF